MQASPEEVLGWQYRIDSDQAIKQHMKRNGSDNEQFPNKIISTINGHHQIVYSCRKLPFPFSPRDWLTRSLFKKIGVDTYVLINSSIPNSCDDVPKFQESTNEKKVRGVFTSLVVFERLPYNCCKFTMTAKADIKGQIPRVVAESGLSGLVNSVRRAYEFFERDKEVDRLEREAFISNIDCAAPPSSDEQLTLDRCMQYTEKHATVKHANQKFNWTRIGDRKDVSVKKFIKSEEGEASAWGKATATIHATAEECLAWLWCFTSNHRMKAHQKKDGNLLRQSFTPDNEEGEEQSRTQHVCVRKAMQVGTQTRETNVRFVWGSTDDDFDRQVLVLAFEPAPVVQKLPKKKALKKSSAFSLASANVAVKTRNKSTISPEIEDSSSEKIVQIHTKGLWLLRLLATNVCEVTLVNRVEDKGR